MCKKVVCFDLDDTLYKEIDFLKSGYHHIANQLHRRYPLAIEKDVYNTMLSTYKMGGNAFDVVVEEYGLYKHPKEMLLQMYREHKPKIQLSDGVETVLDDLKSHDIAIGLITDGRYITQLNKIEALHLRKWIDADDIIINSDESYFKPNPNGYQKIMAKYGANCHYTYVGDNVGKDFLAPNRLGWTTICLLDDRRNIHKQDFSLAKEYLPKYKIEKMSELLGLINLR